VKISLSVWWSRCCESEG